MKTLLQALNENSKLVSYLSLFISIMGAWFTRYTYKRFARNEFIKKQIHEVVELTSYLNGELFEVAFTSFSEDRGSSSKSYTTNIFEIKNLANVDVRLHFIDSPVVFNRTSNQILNIRKYITNPFIPKSIADELEKLYSFNNGDIYWEQAVGNMIVIHSKTFEETIFQSLDNHQAALREPSAFAFESFDNLIECSQLLNKAIVSWLQGYKVKEINIRSYQWEKGQ